MDKPTTKPSPVPTTVYLQAKLDDFLAGDPRAKAELVNRAGERLMILARKLLRGFRPGPAQSGDILSEAYLKLHVALDAVRPATVRQFFGLASLQMRRVLLDLARAAKRGVKVVANDSEHPLDAPAPGDAREDTDLVTDLYEAIDKLDENLKEVVELLIFQGMTQAEAGQVIGVHKDTVRDRWALARVELAELLADFDPKAE